MNEIIFALVKFLISSWLRSKGYPSDDPIGTWKNIYPTNSGRLINPEKGIFP